MNKMNVIAGLLKTFVKKCFMKDAIRIFFFITDNQSLIIDMLNLDIFFEKGKNKNMCNFKFVVLLIVTIIVFCGIYL